MLRPLWCKVRAVKTWRCLLLAFLDRKILTFSTVALLIWLTLALALECPQFKALWEKKLRYVESRCKHQLDMVYCDFIFPVVLQCNPSLTSKTSMKWWLKHEQSSTAEPAVSLMPFPTCCSPLLNCWTFNCKWCNKLTTRGLKKKQQLWYEFRDISMCIVYWQTELAATENPRPVNHGHRESLLPERQLSYI